MRLTILSLVMALLVLTLPAAKSQAQAPSAFVVSVSLAGEDVARKTSVVRAGAELPARIMMPLVAGDIVFVRDPASRIEIEGGDGTVTVVGGEILRFEVTGEIDTGDSTWGILTAIGGVLGGGDELPPETMASRGGTPKVAMARRGINRLMAGRRTLWLGWQNGTAPFTIMLEGSGQETVLAQAISAQDAMVRLPDVMPERFSLSIRDALGQRDVIRFGFGGSLPPLPASAATGQLSQIADVVRLTSLDDGAWTIEAAQQLKAMDAPAADAVLERIAGGWRLD